MKGSVVHGTVENQGAFIIGSGHNLGNGGLSIPELKQNYSYLPNWI